MNRLLPVLFDSSDPQQLISEIDQKKNNLSFYILRKYLKKRLPLELITLILQLAWVLPLQSKFSEVATSISNDEFRYLELTAYDKPVGLYFQIISHDQGWSNFAEDYGTYRNSWTYGFIRVNEKQEKVYVNLHASSEWQLHEKYYTAKSDLVHQIKKGDKISLMVKAEFDGWINHVYSAQLTLYYAI